MQKSRFVAPTAGCAIVWNYFLLCCCAEDNRIRQRPTTRRASLPLIKPSAFVGKRAI